MIMKVPVQPKPFYQSVTPEHLARFGVLSEVFDVVIVQGELFVAAICVQLQSH